MVAEIHTAAPGGQLSRIQRTDVEHDLEIAAPVANGREADPAMVAGEDDASGDGDRDAGGGVGCEVAMGTGDLGTAVRTADPDRVWIPTCVAERVEFRDADAFLFRSPYHRLILRREHGGGRSGRRGWHIDHRPGRGCRPSVPATQQCAWARHDHEALGDAGRERDLRQVAAILEAQVSRHPLRPVFHVGPIERLQLEPAR